MFRVMAPVAAAFALGATPSLHAAEVHIDAVGFDVYYDDALLPFFGTPIVFSGSSLVFTAASNTFEAQSSSTSWAFSGDSFGLRIVADAGYNLSSASIIQAGQLSLTGAASEVYAGGVTRAVDSRSPVISYSPMVGSGVAAIGTAGGTYSRSWETTSTQLFSAGASDVQITIDSLLGARAGTGGTAFVNKGFVTLSVVSLVSPVPEAGGWAMLLAGLGLVGGIARRRLS
ncbi:hypothetical protein GCM10025770_31880 [Viridibacterium curvum]|uniref:PEP-CTERM sorting domain-containing protein n=2 Tax=Viridibacterium curvum TaxID=1101404 RepID=A0ABP9QZG9_9RHOO